MMQFFFLSYSVVFLINGIACYILLNYLRGVRRVFIVKGIAEEEKKKMEQNVKIATVFGFLLLIPEGWWVIRLVDTDRLQPETFAIILGLIVAGFLTFVYLMQKKENLRFHLQL